MRRRSGDAFILGLGMVLLATAPCLSETPPPTKGPDSPNSTPSQIEDADPSLLRPRLWPPVRDPRHVTVHLQGFDPIGGRTMLLWWVQDGPPRLLGKTRSQAEGHFDFGHIPVLEAGQAVTVTSEQGDPLSPTPLWIMGSLE
jgi:hypothetical protein